MTWRQKFTPYISTKATRGWCLKLVDDAGKVINNLPPRTRNARAALDVEIKAKRLRTDTPPKNIWVIGFLDLRAGQWAADDHVFLMKYLGDGKYELRDSETNAGARDVYPNVNAMLAWFGAYSPLYVGWSTHCDGRQYVESYTPVPAKASFTRFTRKGTFKVTVDTLNVRTDPNAKTGKAVATYKKGQTFNYDSYTITNGYVWLSYISNSGSRRYVAEGPYDGNPKNIWGTGGV